MDFAALLSREIAKAKGPSAAKKATPDTETEPSPTTKPLSPAPAKKYINRREAEEARRLAYLAEKKALEAERAAKAAAKRKREDDEAEEARAREEKRRRLAEETRRLREEREAQEERVRRRRLGLPEVPVTEQTKEKGETEAQEEDDEDLLDNDALDPEQLSQKLREIGEPARLFGEGHAARLRRYRKSAGVLVGSDGPIVTTLPPVPESDMKVPAKVPPASDRKARRLLYRQLASYFNMILREWERALAREHSNSSDPDNASSLSLAGQTAIAAMTSSRQTMRPLFRKFERADLEESVLEAVVEIVRAAQERRYVDANDGYLRLSIGKAAWPIGVTMVGIHERSAREKLHDGERGHVMGGEVARKYLQSIKRCLTFAQVRWPPDDIRQLMG